MSFHHEHSDTEFSDGSKRDERHPAELRTALGKHKFPLREHWDGCAAVAATDGSACPIWGAEYPGRMLQQTYSTILKW